VRVFSWGQGDEGCGASGARCWGVGGLALEGGLWECEGFLRAGRGGL
jgi:hypothetical protein